MSAEERLRKREEGEAAARLVRDEVQAKKVAEQEKTARLRALRLQKEAADKARAADIQTMAKPTGRKRDLQAASSKGSPGRRNDTPR
jgi:hypothetical protein